jgi:hypothetical protein
MREREREVKASLLFRGSSDEEQKEFGISKEK